MHFASVDELHAHKRRDVWDVLETATGSRSQPLIWGITTAGTDRSGICYEVRTYITKLLEGIAEGDATFGIIYSIDDEDATTGWTPRYGRRRIRISAYRTAPTICR